MALLAGALLACGGAIAQFADEGSANSAASSGQTGESLGILPDSLGGALGSGQDQITNVPCVADVLAERGEGEDQGQEKGQQRAALACLLGHLIPLLGDERQKTAFQDLFERRFAQHPNWQRMLGADLLGAMQGEEPAPPPNIQGARAAFSDLATAQTCPPVFDGRPLVSTLGGQPTPLYLTTPSGKRDLSPPLHLPPSVEEVLLAGALAHPNPIATLGQTPCTLIRRPMAQALFHSLLAHGRLDAADQLAAQPFMPQRFTRQMAGARQDRAAQDDLMQAALAMLFDRQAALQSPGAATPEVSTILNEIDRQFTIDFLLGQIWAASPAALSDLEFDMAFIGDAARLLSQDAKLLQQGYGGDDTRLFYPDFFAALVAKGAYNLLRGVDLLVPAAMTRYHQLALETQPVRPTDPTTFESSQEILALLIRGQQFGPLADIWGEVRPAQRQDAILFAYDQGLDDVGAFLYERLQPTDLSFDFLTRLSLYLADRFVGEV